MDRAKEVFRTYPVNRYTDESVTRDERHFVREDPLLIRVEGRPYALAMRTPGDEIALAAGFCLSEGLVESARDIASIGFCSESDENCVRVGLHEERRRMVSEQLQGRGFLSRLQAGIDSREMIEELTRHRKVVEEGTRIDSDQVIACVDAFSRHQEYYAKTRGTHAVMLFDSHLDILVKGEDVGRHNAMDKAVGAMLLEDRLQEVYLAVLSSRISYEMIQKAVRAGIPALISLSNPTSMAVELGLKMGMTLITMDKQSGFVVPCGSKRIRTKSSRSGS